MSEVKETDLSAWCRSCTVVGCRMHPERAGAAGEEECPTTWEMISYATSAP